MTMIFAIVPFAMIAQSSQDVYAVNDDFSMTSYAALGNGLMENEVKTKSPSILDVTNIYVSESDLLEVDDMLLANPDFDIQENMIAFTKDQKTVYFSANKTLKAQKGSATDVKIKKSVQLQMFRADVKENGEWENLELLAFNGKRHSTGQPSLNADDSKLYFVADGPLSTGKTDIFVVDLNADGTYSKPLNMGSKINSLEREVLPLVDDSNVLYFASDVETEGDELDVFASMVVDNTASTPIKLDVEANSSKEDYIAAFEAIDAEAAIMAEEAANLRDLEILLEAETLTEIERVEEVFTEELSGDAYDFSSEAIVYTVQIGAFQQSVDTDTYGDSSVLFNHVYEDGYNRFYSGVFKTEAEALGHLEQMKKEGYDDAFVLGLNGEKRFLAK